MPEPSPSPRLPALDVVRAAAMLLGVVLHACAPYMHVPLRGLIMPVQEYAASRLPDTLFWVLHSFRVPMFFVVAGFFARDVLSRRTPDEFLTRRWKRLGIPLLVAYPTLTIAMHPVWLWGWVDRGWASWGHLFSFKYGPELERAVWGFNHLWFLEYLLLYCVIVWLFAKLVRRPKTEAKPVAASIDRAGSRVQVVRTSDISFGEQSVAFVPPTEPPPRAWRLIPISMIAIALGAWTFSSDASWYLDFQNSYLPHALPFAFYAIFFVLGLVLRRQWLRPLALAAPILLLVAVMCLAPMLSLISTSVWMTDHGPRQGRLLDSASDRLLLGFLVSVIAVLGSLGVVGVSTLLFRKATRMSSFLVDSAYWVFLTHLFWIGVGVMILHKTPGIVAIRPEWKMVIGAIFAGAASLATFVPVRRTRLGRWLGAGSFAPTR